MGLNEIKGLERDLLEIVAEVCEFKVSEVPDDFISESPLLGPKSLMGLDSLDAVEIVVMLQTKYKVRLSNKPEDLNALTSLKTMADYIRKKSSVIQ